MLQVHNLSLRYRGTDRILFRQLSFTLNMGERLALLGRNGQGKSSLLKVLGGVLTPTEGSLAWNMSCSWPLGFAGGFQGGMSGYDNIRFIARIYDRPIAWMIDRVEEFAELGEALSRPVKQYSSGMRARLAFGLSLAVEFDCYLIDEIISVGDAAFRDKCLYEILEKRRDRAFIIASHELEFLRTYCNRAIVIDSGKARLFSEVDSALDVYHHIVLEHEAQAGRSTAANADAPLDERLLEQPAAWGAAEAVVLDSSAFWSGDSRQMRCSKIIDLAGPYRHLFRGPGLELEPGYWAATIRLVFSEAAANKEYHLSFGDGANLITEVVEPGASGVREFTLERVLDPGNRTEIRLWLQSTSFHGEIGLVGVKLTRRDGGPCRVVG